MEVTDEDGDNVFVSSDGSMIRLKKGRPRSRCGGVLYETEFPNLFLADHDLSLGVPEFQRPLHESEMSLATYTNQQNSFLYHELVEQIQKRMRSAHQERCRLDESRRRAHYAHRAAEQHAISDGETVHLGNGQFVTAAGAVWYHYRCRAMVVKARSTSGCFAALPVQLSEEDFDNYLRRRHLEPPSQSAPANDNELPPEADQPHLQGSDHLYVVNQNRFYLEPRTHRLLTVATPSVCASPFLPLYMNRRGQWMAYNGPDFHLAPTPEALDHIKWEFSSDRDDFRFFNFAEGGFYTSEQIKRMDRFSQAPTPGRAWWRCSRASLTFLWTKASRYLRW